MKRYVLPAVKILVGLVIAVALTKIAFFPSQGSQASGGPTPSYEVSRQTTVATVGDISNTVDVKGQIVEDAPVEAPATLNGVVDSFAVSAGATVTQGTPLLYLKHVEAQEPRTSTDEEGNTVSRPQKDKVTWATVYAPTSGTVAFTVIKDQETSVGTVVARVSPGTYSATGTITPSQQYRLTSAPTTAALTLEGGPAPFTCEGLTIGTRPSAVQTTDPQGNSGTSPGDGTSVQVRCPVPADQTVFPGLPVTIGIDAGSASGAVLVPVTAVEGSSTSGIVWVVADPSKPDAAQQREVGLGINDGTSVQITSGLTEGEEVLLFVPNKDVSRTGKPNSCDQYACYDENGEEYL